MPDTLSISFTPGYTFIAEELVTYDKLNLLGRGTFTLNGTIGAATISDGAVTTAKLADGVLSADTTGRAKMADGYLTAAKLNATQDWTGKTLSGTPAVTWSGVIDFNLATFTPPPGHQVQAVATSQNTISTVTSTFPLDDTIPQNTEGTELTTLATTITPKSATNYLEISVEIPYGGPASSAHLVALFQDSTANALAASWAHLGSAATYQVLKLTHRMLAGTTSATTFKVRIGTIGGSANITVNGLSSARLFGSALIARVLIKEIQA